VITTATASLAMASTSTSTTNSEVKRDQSESTTPTTSVNDTNPSARPARAADTPDINDGDIIEVGNLQLRWSQRLLPMIDSTHLLHKPTELTAGNAM
jgi:hypothetical protein